MIVYRHDGGGSVVKDGTKITFNATMIVFVDSHGDMQAIPFRAVKEIHP